MTQNWLSLKLSAPFMSFGGETVDHVGPTRDFPASSMLTGLLGNALGWKWSDRVHLQCLQDRLVYAATCAKKGRIRVDNQNAKLEKKDKGWTTLGMPEGRPGGGADTFKSPHRRQREYIEDSVVYVVCRLVPEEEIPNLNDLRKALIHPARPLFVGRKSCLPSDKIFQEVVIGETAYEALQTATKEKNGSFSRSIWPQREGPKGDRAFNLTDQRNWSTDLHGGSRVVHEGRLP